MGILGILMILVKALYFMMPAYFANAAPVLTKNVFRRLAYPVDFNKKLNGKPIFGPHKTYRGLLMAVLFGLIIFIFQKCLYNYAIFRGISIINYTEYSVLLGVLLGLGAISGDLAKSYFKRRLSREAGSRWIPFDQLDFVIGALLFAAILYIPSWEIALAIFILSFCIHVSANHIGYWIGIRDVKW